MLATVSFNLIRRGLRVEHLQIDRIHFQNYLIAKVSVRQLV